MTVAQAPAFGVVRLDDQRRVLDLVEKPQPPRLANFRTAPAWLERVPEARPDDLGPQRRLLLAVGLLLRRAPVLAREPSFLSTARGWVPARFTCTA